MCKLQRKTVLVVLAVLAVLSLSPSARAQTVTVKMATLVPQGSSWHLILQQMAEEWKTASGGKVAVRLYPGGVAGDDPDVVRKMRLGTLNAGVLTAVGLAEIDKSVYALGVPLMYDSYDEIYGVLEKLRPSLEAKMQAKGFVVLAWADGGWVRYFSQKPVAKPDDLRALKLFSWAGDPQATELQKAARFNPVPLPSTELATALQTGLVQAFGAPPGVALIAQYYTHAKYMTDLDWQMLMGAVVITKDAWDKIPADVQGKLRASAEKAGERLRDEIRAGTVRDIDAMKKRGLVVVPVDGAARRQWQQLTEGLYPRIRGGIVPAEAFDAALHARDAWRAAHKASAPK
jgi:TRAP-type C4-dicarboxylate transport system substrate-binding protein